MLRQANKAIWAAKLMATTALAAALALSGCGSQAKGPLLTISFQSPTGGPLTERALDMSRAAQLFVDGPGKNVAGSRLALGHGARGGSIATIDALAANAQHGLDELEITLTPPRERRTARPPRERAGGLPIALVPPHSLAVSAAAQYAASDVPGAKGATVDSPTDPGTPQGRYVTAALSEHAYPPAGSAFFRKFSETYGRVPDRWAIYAYEAVGLVADAIRRLDANGVPITPRAVKDEATTIRNRYGAIGHYDILPSGQTTGYIFQARGAGTDPNDPATLIEALR